MKLRNLLLNCSPGGNRRKLRDLSLDQYSPDLSLRPWNRNVTNTHRNRHSSGCSGNSTFYDGNSSSDSELLIEGCPVKIGERVVWPREEPYSNEPGIVRWIGELDGEKIAGIEFDNQLNIGSGWYKNRQLFQCRPNHGGLVAVIGLIREEDLSTFEAQSRTPIIGPETLSKMPSSIPYLQAPLREDDVERMIGNARGIQGHRNSCYLDATLFAMFSFNSVFDAMLLERMGIGKDKEEVDLPLATEVQRILREDIVNPLRKELMTPACNVMRLREVMVHLDDKLTSEEMDPQEFLEILFRRVFHLDEFIALSSGEFDYFHQVLCKGDVEKIPTVQQLFEESLIEQKLKLKSIPSPALILQMPRSGNKFKMFKGVLPNLTIDITDLMEDTPRMCIICGSLAVHECPDCFGLFTTNDRDSTPLGSAAYSTSFCTECKERVHSRRDRQNHRSIYPIKYSKETMYYYSNSSFFGSAGVNSSRSIPRVTLDLFAVICIETSHFVSFVKCGQDPKAPWIFFDSMADRVEGGAGGGHNVPQVKFLPKMGNWLQQLESEPGILQSTLDNGMPELKRLLSDPYICLYHSAAGSMYG